MVPLSPVVAVMLVTMQSVYCTNVPFSSRAKGTYVQRYTEFVGDTFI